MTTGDWINLGLLVVAVFGFGLTISQLKSGFRTQRAQFLKDLYTTSVSDIDISEAYYLIEYDKFIYNSDFHDSNIEPKVDRLLSFYDLVAELNIQEIISDREMIFFSYRFKRIFNNKGIKEYLIFLSSFYKNNGIDKEPFSSFQTVANKYIV